MGERYRTLVDVFEHYTNDLFKRIGVDRSESTWWRYRAVLGHLRAFLKYEYNLHDIPLLELEQSFIEQYHVYLGNDAKSGWCRIGSNDQNCTILVICVS